MTPNVKTLTFPLPDVNKKEALRYAGTDLNDEKSLAILDECINEAHLKSGKVCYCTLSVKNNDDKIDFGMFSVQSKNLECFFQNADKTVLFAATIGLELDRLITKYAHFSPVKAVMLHALGSERVEALCDAFCDYIKKEFGTACAKRFSPGYGDLPLELQKEIIPLLNANKNCGIYLNDSLLLSPSKTVTAFINLKNED